MKILITGPNSYIAKQCKNRFIINGFNEEDISFLSLRDDSWMNYDLKGFDSVIHCAGLVHKNEKKIPLETYIKINADLTEAVAKKAKEEGVSQFVFFSTKAVYGLGKSCFNEKITYADTEPHPKTKYGISKLEAEQRLNTLRDRGFKIAILRPPLVYGRGASGNYQKYRKFVLKYKLLPDFDNHLSMIYVENLCELVCQIVVERREGVFLPQDLPLRNSTALGREIAKYNNARIIISKALNPIVSLGSLFIKSLNSAFGGSSYDEKASKIEGIDYQIYDFEESMRRTELGEA